jgi:nucleotide-binding universal stress UspA family protein
VVEFKQILYPTDLSDASLPALTYAAALARWYGARLTVLHVVPTFEAIEVPPNRIEGAVRVLYPPPREEVLAEMEETLPAGAHAGADVQLSAVAGDAAGTILDQAVTLPADLIVMGTHGRSGFDRLIFGSVTERVIQRAPCPVLTVPPHADVSGDVVFKRILCPMDYSPASLQALGFALDLARQSGASVTVLHVLEGLAEEKPGGQRAFNIDEYRVHLIAEAQDELQDLLLSEFAGEAEGIHREVATGRAHREILRMAEARHADLIVMGAQGRGGVGLALFGSTTHQVARAAHCPVLVARKAAVEPYEVSS